MDTPRFEDTFKAGATILDSIEKYLADLFNQKQNVASVVYIHPITEVRIKGPAVKNLNMFRKVVGAENMSSYYLVTTKWSLQSEGMSMSREDETKNNPSSSSRFCHQVLKSLN